MLDPIDRYASRRSTVQATNGVVATSQPLASQAGLRVLEEGGNAFDAAVTTAAVLSVVEPFNAGPGGDVFALYRTANGDVGGMRSCGGAPSGVDLEDLRQTYDGEEPTLPSRSPHTVTPPGTIRGWEETVDNFGQRSLSTALAPAIRYATEGFPVTEVIANQWEIGEEELTGKNAREAYLVDGNAPQAGKKMTLPHLGESLETVARKGANALYDGPLGEAIISEVSSRGGALSESDLAAVDVEWLDPISTTYNGVEVYELPPNNQGPIALEALNIAEALDAGDYEYMSTEGVHRYVEAMKVAFEDGHRYITDPSFKDVPDLTDKSYATRRATEVNSEAAEDVEVGVPGSRGDHSDTVLLTVADKEGNIVSFINSIFDAFGSGFVAGETGILLQNRGSSFSLDPNHPNRYAPGKKPFHTLIPALAKFGSDDWAAFGVMGGYMQPQGHLQVLSSIIDHGLGLQEALDASRWFYRETGELSVESRMDSTLQTQLVRRGHDIDVDTPDYFGGGQIVRNDGGILSGATDPRKDGTVAGF